MQLRPYQIEIKKQAIEGLKVHNTIMLQLPTGSGKTVLFSSITKKFVDRSKIVWILVHRKELIDQAVDKLRKYDLLPSIIQADHYHNFSNKVQVASVQTLVRRLDKVKPPDLIIIDEAHHATANTYRKILSAFPAAKVLGVTATPIRTNGDGFREIFNKLICGPRESWFIEQGYLVKPLLLTKPLNINLSKIKTKAGDYNEKELYSKLNKAKIYGDYVGAWKKYANNLMTIVFAINIEHSKTIVETYRKFGINAEHLDGKTDKYTRQRIINKFKNGEITVLSNVELFFEGFDVPDTECVQLARPTKSLSMYKQMVGRGLRPSQGKDRCIILDHANCVFEHGMPEQDREWTLSGLKIDPNKKSKYKVKDKKTGKTYEPYEVPDHVSEIELVSVDFDVSRFPLILKWLDKASRFNRKPAWAWYRFIDQIKKTKIQEPTATEIDYFINNSGMKPGFGYYQKKEYGYIK